MPDLNGYTVNADECGDTELSCQRCPLEVVASSHGVLGSAKQLPNPITLSALLTAATQHEVEAHPRG